LPRSRSMWREVPSRAPIRSARPARETGKAPGLSRYCLDSPLQRTLFEWTTHTGDLR
jgi:hypothetical protein